MEKTMANVYLEDTKELVNLAVKIQEYAEFEFSTGYISGQPYTKLLISQSEVERLKSIPYEQPKDKIPANPIFSQEDFDKQNAIFDDFYKHFGAIKQPQGESVFNHKRNIEILTLEHQHRMELEEVRNRTAFDKKSTEAMQAIFSMGKDLKDAGISETDIQKNKRYAAIYWCHQQAALLPTNTYAWQVDNSQNVLKSIDITANYLFKTFFPDLQ